MDLETLLKHVDHELKTDPNVFEQTWRRLKKVELRFNDRNYQQWDKLLLRETKYSGDQMKSGKPLVYTGRYIVFHVTHILSGGIYGMFDEFVAMSGFLDEMGFLEK